MILWILYVIVIYRVIIYVISAIYVIWDCACANICDLCFVNVRYEQI